MKIKYILLNLLSITIATLTLTAQEIPIEHLDMELQPAKKNHNKIILKNEINGIQVNHIALLENTVKQELMENDCKFIYLFIKRQGTIITNKKNYSIVPETIFLPNSIQHISISAKKNDTLHFLKISSKLTEQDIEDLKTFPKENTQTPYFKKFVDCEAYTEPIKSPNTISRTVLPNKYIPRIALGTVETIGPDKVGAHKHAMLEQLFLGLTDNNVIVYADEAKVDFPEYSLLHIPLGSSHSVDVFEGKKMYYMWMDFFRDKKGEEWLKTHKTKK